MPRSKSVNTYPPALWQICERCAVGKEVFETAVPSITAALSLQGQFYAFRGALRREYDAVRVRGKDPDWEEKLKAYIEFSAITVCWVDRPKGHIAALGGPVKVKFMHRDKTPSGELLTQLLETGKKEDKASSEIDASALELLSKIDPSLVVTK